MKILLQRVKKSSVTVSNQVVSEIGKGLLLLVGIGKDETPADLDRLAQKILNFRIFEDENGKMNLNIQQVSGEILSVSQFTLYADTKKGNRPGFDQAAKPDLAKELWQEFNQKLRLGGITVKEGIFAAKMEVELVNEGPVTFWLE
ncbi:D-tyrosyl-tRNA(Tyr) deacylase [bacterium F11]|nr:D-tyrosyl-tRNA(Tyr) deacylase [bacterium F11]